MMNFHKNKRGKKVKPNDFLKTKNESIGKDNEHAKNILNFLCECWEKELYCDLTVKIGKRLYKTHRLVLAMISDYFRALMQFDGPDKDTIVLNNENVDEDCFETILKFAYTGEIDFQVSAAEAQHVQDLAEVCDFLGVLTLKNLCEKNLIECVTKENSMPLYVFSEIYNMFDLCKAAKRCFTRNYVPLCDTKDFCDIPLKILIKYLKDDDLKIYKSENIILKIEERESFILKSVIKYIEKNLEMFTSTSLELAELLKVVKLPLFDNKYLQKIIKNTKRLKKDPSVLKIVALADSYRLNGISSSEVPDFWTTERKMHHYFTYGRAIATGNQVGRVNFNEFCHEENSLDPYAVIKKICIWVRKWDGRIVIGAIEVVDSNGNVMYGGESDTSKMEKKHEFELKEDEVITEIVTHSGWVVDNFLFKTNLKNTYGPFGGDGGGCRVWSPTVPTDCYLHSFKGANVVAQGSITVVHLSCRWIQFE